jgi:hypothetical protein
MVEGSLGCTSLNVSVLRKGDVGFCDVWCVWMMRCGWCASSSSLSSSSPTPTPRLHSKVCRPSSSRCEEFHVEPRTKVTWIGRWCAVFVRTRLSGTIVRSFGFMIAGWRGGGDIHLVNVGFGPEGRRRRRVDVVWCFSRVGGGGGLYEDCCSMKCVMWFC